MNLPKISRQQWLRFAAALAAILLTLALLVLIPLKTHRTPVPELRHLGPRPTPTPLPSSGPVNFPPEMFYPDDSDHDNELQQIVDQFLDEHPGDWDIYVYNLSHGDLARSPEEEAHPMVSASLIKLFIMGATFQQVQDGKANYWDVYNTVQRMIIYSDNYSANGLIKYLGEGEIDVGLEIVNAFIQSIGCSSTSMHRLMLDTDSDEENYTSAEDCALLLKMLYRYELVSPQYSSDMIEILKEQQTNDRIPALLPEGTVCAHKTGDLEHLSCGDVGLVFSPNADYILSVINNHSDDDAATILSIAAFSAQIYEHFNPPAPETPEPEAEITAPET